MNEKVPPSASNRRKRELAREGDLLTYKRKRKTIDPSTVVPPNTLDSTNEGVCEGVNIPTESAKVMNIPQGLEFETESAQAGLGAQPPFPNIFPDFDENIHIFGGYSEAILEVFENNLLQDLNAFKSLKAGGAGNSLSLKNLKSHYAYKLEKVVWDPYRDKRDSPHAFKEVNFFYGTLTSPDHVQPYYPNRVVWQFNREQGIPTKRLLTEVSDLWNAKVTRKFSPKYEWVGCFSSQKWKEFVLKKTNKGRRVREGPLVCTEAYLEWFASVSWTTICPITIDLAADDSGIHQRKPASVNEHGDTPVHQSEDIAEQYDASLAVLQSHQPVPDTTLAKKYEDLLAEHEDIKKKLIAKEDFRHKLVNAEERMKSLEANNSEWHKKLVNSEDRKKTLVVDNNEWEVWRQVLKKALASEGMRDMGDPTFEELFEQNEGFFTIVQQGPKGDYQEDLVSTAVTLKNVVIDRREKMAK
ncbi:hypothetical protein GIB67_036402 [Kingdonia uniflora]|uniref:Uncharacterized protein n=1 Tax=Kingdonia uniflora TaxID=39325 RepID=A0A7J7L411_9MAGN|nr:hypothetical protein GIB67_036402 [Kingdonia uniflora]